VLAKLRAPRGPLHHDPVAVRQARQARDMTQLALAEALGVSQGYMSEIERGTRGASPELLARIAEALDCPVESLTRKRPLACPACGYGYDPQPNRQVPLHTSPGSDDWCDGSGSPDQEAAA